MKKSDTYDLKALVVKIVNWIIINSGKETKFPLPISCFYSSEKEEMAKIILNDIINTHESNRLLLGKVYPKKVPDNLTVTECNFIIKEMGKSNYNYNAKSQELCYLVSDIFCNYKLKILVKQQRTRDIIIATIICFLFALLGAILNVALL